MFSSLVSPELAISSAATGNVADWVVSGKFAWKEDDSKVAELKSAQLVAFSDMPLESHGSDLGEVHAGMDRALKAPATPKHAIKRAHVFATKFSINLAQTNFQISC